MTQEKMIEIWNTIPNKRKNYSGIEVVGEIEILNYFTRKELNSFEEQGWMYNNHAEYDMAEPSYNLINQKQK